MRRLDRTGQRIVGVLIEKQLAVPDSYPLSENALVDGCNQKSNRDPAMELASFQVAGALMALQEAGWVARVEGGGRVARFRHRLTEELGVDAGDLAVLAELLLRGPQAPGALKPRVARMGLAASPEAIEQRLRGLAARTPPLVELLPLGPRERDARWRQCLGDGSESEPAPAGVAAVAAPAGVAAVAAPAAGTSMAVAGGLEARVALLEQRLAALQQQVDALGRGGAG
ncbi:MAG: DUF480 domain-containing protein [Planctomycetes bacterium]|nr:DUF480 domain-containing protein [Planctomycetota bacterium]